MPTLEIVPTDMKEQERRKAKAQKHFDAIVKAGGVVSTNSLRVGYHAYRLKAENLFGLLGFKDEEEAQVASGVGESTWYANIKIAGAFKDVPEDVFVKMKQGNARVAMDLPESKRQDSYWLRLAETESLKKFSGLVDEEMNGKARASDGKERPAKVTLDVPASRKKVIETGLKKYGESIGVEDSGQALELLLAESNGGGMGLIEAITTATAHIKWCKETMHGELSADEIIARVEETLDQIVLDFQKALEGAAQHETAA